MASGVLDKPLMPVPAPLFTAGPRICVVALDDYRRGLLTGRWLDLRAQEEALCQQLDRVIIASGGSGTLGLFDYEDVHGGINGAVSISELRLRCQMHRH